jgi:hypothetical protein
MLITIHGLPFPPNRRRGCDRPVSTGLEIEIKPVGSLDKAFAVRVANRPMMSVPFLAYPVPSPFKTQKMKRFADRFL